MLRTITVLAVAVAAAGGCGSTTSPSTDPVRVTVQATPTLAGSPDIATFTLRVENISRSTVDLTFPSSCQLLPHFVDRRTGQEATPRGGGFACLAVITQKSLQAGESFSDVITVAAGDAVVPNRIVLPAGDYAVYARLEDSTYRTRSEQVSFSVR